MSDKCPLCNNKYNDIETIYGHMEKDHSDSIPKNFSTSQAYYALKTGKDHGSCVVCHHDTRWNESTHKYNRFCDMPKCKDIYREEFKKRMIGKFGKVHLLSDPNQQKKMLENRSISGKYTWSDGKELTYTGTYELDFLKFMDVFLQFESDDVMAPSPHVYYYEYQGEEKFYIPDFFIPSLDLEIEVKEGGKNPNMMPKIQAVDKVKEKLKDEVLMSQKEFNYIKLTDKNYEPMFKFLTEAKEQFAHSDRMRTSLPIFIIGESTTMNELAQIENRLLEFCYSNNIDYYDDMILLESYNYMNSSHSILEESVLSMAWTALVKTIASVAKAVVWIWKQVIAFFKMIWSKLKSLLGLSENKPTKVSNPPKLKVLVASAGSTKAEIKEFTVSNINELKPHIEAINNEMNSTLNQLNTKQLHLMEEEKRFIESKARHNITEAKIRHGHPMSGTSRDAEINQRAGIGDDGPVEMSLGYADVIIGAMHKDIEKFDMDMNKKLLESTATVDDYNQYIMLEMNKIKNAGATDPGIGKSLYAAYMGLVDLKFTETEIQEIIREMFVVKVEDPQVMHKIISLRLNYNRKITDLLRKMVTENYKILGLTNAHLDHIVNLFSSDDSASAITKIKHAVNANHEKFIKGNGITDLRPLGAGVIFMTTHDLHGVEEDVILSRMIQDSLLYDAVVIGHGTTGDKDLYPKIEAEVSAGMKEMDDLHAKVQPLYHERDNFSDMHGYTTKIDALYERLNELHREFIQAHGSDEMKKVENERKSVKDELEKIRAERDAHEEKVEAQINEIHEKMKEVQERVGGLQEKAKEGKLEWIIQPVHSLHAGPFVSMNELIAQLIKEGFKKILIMSCNPGHHVLAPEIQHAKGVIIRHGTNSIFVESSNIYDSDYIITESSEFYTMKKFYPATIAYAAKDIDKGAEIEVGYKFKGEKDIAEDDKKDGAVSTFFDEHEMTPLAHIIEYDRVGNLMLIQTNNSPNEYTFVASKNIKEGDKLKVNWDSYKTYFGEKYTDFFGESADFQYIMEVRLNKAERDKLPDSAFGIPELRKFLLVDAGNVRDAIIHFKFCPSKYRKELASRIYNKAKEKGVDVSGKGQWFKYLSDDKKAEVVGEGYIEVESDEDDIVAEVFNMGVDMTPPLAFYKMLMKMMQLIHVQFESEYLFDYYTLKKHLPPTRDVMYVDEIELPKLVESNLNSFTIELRLKNNAEKKYMDMYKDHDEMYENEFKKWVSLFIDNTFTVIDHTGDRVLLRSLRYNFVTVELDRRNYPPTCTIFYNPLAEKLAPIVIPNEFPKMVSVIFKDIMDQVSAEKFVLEGDDRGDFMRLLARALGDRQVNRFNLRVYPGKNDNAIKDIIFRAHSNNMRMVSSGDDKYNLVSTKYNYLNMIIEKEEGYIRISIFVDRTKILWGGAKESSEEVIIERFNSEIGDSGNLRYTFHPIIDNNPHIQQLLDSAKKIWIGTDYHLYKFKDGNMVKNEKFDDIIHNQTSMVKDNDVFIYLGDLADGEMKDPGILTNIIKKLKGIKILVLGNNDTMPDDFYRKAGFKFVVEGFQWRDLIFSHQAIDHPKGTKNIHGHFHGGMKYYDVRYDNHIGLFTKLNDNKPILLTDVLAEFPTGKFHGIGESYEISAIHEDGKCDSCGTKMDEKETKCKKCGWTSIKSTDNEAVDESINHYEGKLYEIKKSTVAGKGTFAVKDIQAGEGFGLGFKRVARTGTPDKDYIRTSLGKYTNHSTSPNVKMIRTGDRHDFIASRNVHKGEELTINYNEFDWEGKREFAKESTELLEESVLFSDPDTQINMDKWKKEKGKNILFITGLSGSGKSTLAMELAKKHHAEVIHLDTFEHPNDILTDTRDNIKHHKGWLFIHDYYNKVRPDLKKTNVGSDFKHVDWSKVDNKTFFIELGKFIQWMYDQIEKDPNTLYIIEGIQIAMKFNPHNVNKSPLIVKGTSTVNSYIQAQSRDRDGVIDTIKDEIRNKGARIKFFYDTHSVLNEFKKQILSESIEVLLMRPDIHAQKTVLLYHGTDTKYDTLKPVSKTMGTRLSLPRYTTYLTDDYKVAYISAILGVITQYAKIHGMARKKDYSYNMEIGTFYIRTSIFNDEMKKYLENSKIYIYHVTVNTEDLKVGHVPNEFTIDKELSSEITRIETIPYTAFKKDIILLNDGDMDKQVEWYESRKGPYVTLLDKIVYKSTKPERELAKIYLKNFVQNPVKESTDWSDGTTMGRCPYCGVLFAAESTECGDCGLPLAAWRWNDDI